MLVAEKKLSFIQNQIKDPELKFDLSKNFKSTLTAYRENIRAHLSAHYSSYFSRQQLGELADLNIIPESSRGFFSISHCQSVGGFSYSNFPHGLDIEVLLRISNPVILRTTSNQERSLAPDSKFLWVAKEAAFKAYGRINNNFVITDFICEKWVSHSETGVHSFRITSEKTLASKINQGFLFSEEDVLVAIYFK